MSKMMLNYLYSDFRGHALHAEGSENILHVNHLISSDMLCLVSLYDGREKGKKLH